MLAALIAADRDANSGLGAYIRNLMAVMVFDAQRRGRLITAYELDEYSRLLATAVTEALHYYIGHDGASPHDETRYLAVTAAHITHLLRDTHEDVAAGYYNIPCEVLEAHNLTPADVHHPAYRAWVKERVTLARHYFNVGRGYLARVENRRCRAAGYAYMARFTGVLDAIESEDYYLRADYPERKRVSSILKLLGTVASAL
jgi:phytoene/squalene synthetase